MPREKTVRRDTGSQEVIYSADRWSQMGELRLRAKGLMEVLDQIGVEALLHGSLCRGDVSEQSDVDIYLPRVLPSFSVEFALNEAGYQIIHRELVHATPFHAVKAHIYLPKNSVVTLPLTNPAPIELEFYQFGGCLNLSGLQKERRVPGVDKRLFLIEPIEEGHVDTSKTVSG